MESTDYLKVQPKKFAPRTQEETSEGKFWKGLRFLEFDKQVWLVVLGNSQNVLYARSLNA